MDANLLYGLGRILAFEQAHRVPAGLENLDDHMLRDIGYEPGVGWMEDVEARMAKASAERTSQPTVRLRPSHA